MKKRSRLQLVESATINDSDNVGFCYRPIIMSLCLCVGVVWLKFIFIRNKDLFIHQLMISTIQFFNYKDDSSYNLFLSWNLWKLVLNRTFLKIYVRYVTSNDSRRQQSTHSFSAAVTDVSARRLYKPRLVRHYTATVWVDLRYRCHSEGSGIKNTCTLIMIPVPSSGLHNRRVVANIGHWYQN